MCQELFQDRSAPTYQGSSVTTSPGSSAGNIFIRVQEIQFFYFSIVLAMSPDRWKDKNVPTSLASSVRQCRDNSALTCPARLVRSELDWSADLRQY